MPALPENGYIQLTRITDDLGNPARVSQIGGVWRLAVDAIVGGGGGAAQTGAFDSGVADETQIGLYVRSGVTGLHGGLAALARNVPIEARAPGTSPLDERLYGLYALAYVRALDLSAAAGSQGIGVGAVGSTSVSASSLESAYGLATVQARESGYAAAKRGKRFYATNQSIYSYGTLLTAQTAFVTTTPTLLMRCNSAAIRSVIRQINLAIGNTPGGTVYIAVHLDTTDRYVSGGVLSTPQNTNEESATAAVLKVYENPTASVVGATARPLCSTLAPATPGTTIQISFADGVLLGHTAASLLIYVWAASTAPQILWNTEHEEVT